MPVTLLPWVRAPARDKCIIHLCLKKLPAIPLRPDCEPCQVPGRYTRDDKRGKGDYRGCERAASRPSLLQVSRMPIKPTSLGSRAKANSKRKHHPYGPCRARSGLQGSITSERFQRQSPAQTSAAPILMKKSVFGGSWECCKSQLNSSPQGESGKISEPDSFLPFCKQGDDGYLMS